MPRYATRPKADDGDWYSPPLLTNVTVSDHEPTFTGLLDANGEEIWRMPNPIGFGRDDEW